jgi:uncharacterized membrane protein YheB (UPF0754 family)
MDFNSINWNLVLVPVIAAAIGWFTNWVAIKMLFRPKNPINLGFYTIQGVFPKRKEMFAEKIGDLVGNQLFNFDDIKSKFNTPENRESIEKTIDERIHTFLKTKLAAEMPMLAFIMTDSLTEKIKGTLMNEFKEMLPTVLDNFADNLSKNIDVKAIVKQKVADFSTDKLEEVIQSILQKELKFIEIIGAILGFLIGLIQLLLV